MGGRFSHVHYREQDAAVVPHFLLLTQVWYVSLQQLHRDDTSSSYDSSL